MHISRVNCAEMVGDKPTQPAYEIFAIECRLQQSKSRPSTFKDVCTSGCQIGIPPLKKWLFFCYTSTNDVLFNWYQHWWPWM